SSGFIRPSTGPTSSPASDITTIAGKRNFQAIHCEPTPRNKISINSNKMDNDIFILSNSISINRYKKYCNRQLQKSKLFTPIFIKQNISFLTKKDASLS